MFVRPPLARVPRTRACVLLALLALITPLTTETQAATRMPGVGVITTRSQDYEAFRRGLREQGWVDGANVAIEHRAVDTHPERLADAASELVGLKVDCLVSAGNLPISILKRATQTIPIVMAFSADSVGSGFVADLRRPGGNITGLTNINEVLTGKRLELLKRLHPGMVRVGVLRDPTIRAHDTIWREAQSSAAALGLKVFTIDYRNAKELEAVLTTTTRGSSDGLLVPQSPIVMSMPERVVSFTTEQRWPAIYQSSLFVRQGGLMSYGPDEPDLWRRSATYVDKILRGAKPADLPVEQPTKFELVINAKTAKALGLTIPPSLLLQADQVIK